MMIGAISFKILFEIKSAPELAFGFSCLQLLRMSTYDISEENNKLGFSSGKKFLKSKSVSSTSEASLGPTPVKKSIKSICHF